jgi:hypothetical protein
MIKNKRSEGKIKTHYGMVDYFKFFKNKYSTINIDRVKYSNIISDFNDELINLIIEDNLEYNIPYLGSTLSIKKEKRTPKIVNGKLYNTVPVDWVATNKLWSDDSEARDKKLLVRYSNIHSSKYVFRIYFKKYKQAFFNKRYYFFKPTRTFQRLLGSRIKDDNKEKYNSFLLY